nr:zinc-binding dehydrogenase [Saccharomonospora sp. CUA-673]
MRAVVVDGSDTLRVTELPRPEPGPGEVLLRVRAFGVNNIDALQRRGIVPAPASGVPGLECVGDVVGGAVDGLPVGTRVGALLRSGGYAEYVTVPVGACMPLPDGLGDAEAASLPESLATSWWNLVHRGRLRAGEHVLVRGVAGGIGVVAAQVARHRGATVVGTARGAAADRCASGLGLAGVVDHTADDLAARVRALCPDGIDVLLDNQGGPALETNVAMLAPLGRLVVVGTQAGGPGTVDVGALMRLGAEVSSSSSVRCRTRGGPSCAPRWPRKPCRWWHGARCGRSSTRCSRSRTSPPRTHDSASPAKWERSS